MQTSKDRVDIASNYCFDEDVTLVEAYRHLYHWFRAEMNAIKYRKALRAFKAHNDQLNHDLIVLRLRKQMKDL